MDRRTATLLAALALGLAYPAVCASSWQLGAGISVANVSSNYSAIGTQSAEGFSVDASWEFLPTWSVEGFGSFGHKIATGTTQQIYYPPDHAEYGIFIIGVRKDFWPLADRGWTPWLLAGSGVGQVYWDTYFYEVAGSGLAGAGGFDLRLGKSPALLRAQLLYHQFSGDDTYGHGPYSVRGTLASVMLMFRFGDEED